MRAKRSNPRTAHARRARTLLVALLGMLVIATLPAGRASAATHARTRRPRATVAASRAIRPKAPPVEPSRPIAGLAVHGRMTAPTGPSGPATSTATPAAATAAAAAAVTDTTPPTAPGIPAAQASLTAITANWSPAQDAESGVTEYVFGIGTLASGDYSTLANVRWWQVTYATSINVSLTLDPSLTYYVSVYAVNGAGLDSTTVTSGPIQPGWTPVGQPGNVLQIAFASAGLDANGNPAPGWTTDQINLMSSFFTKMYPILVQIYGPPAVSYTVTVVRDLRYHNSNIFIPSTSEIHKDDNFSPQLFTHELVHAFRGTFLLSSDQNWNYDPTLSGFEESFAQAVSYDAMNQYVATYPNDSIVPGNTLYGSSNDWDYDFQNMPELRGTDFWSDGGGTGLYWLRYEMGAAAMRKIELESPGFFRNFNQEYYRRINANPLTVRPTRALIVDIIKTLVPQIEGLPADVWINQQNIFYAQNVYGEKIFHRIQDYPWTQFFAFQDMYFLDTMSCGSEWVCWDGQQYVYYRLNGSQGSGQLTDDDGNSIWSGPLSIAPAQNPSDGYYAFGAAHKGLTTASTLDPWPGGSTDDYVMNLNTLELYNFSSTFVDPVTQAATTNSIYRVIGSPIANNFTGVWGGVLGHKNGTLYLNHEGFAAEPGIPVTHGAFAATRSWAGVPDARTGGRDSVPGRVFATFVDSDTGATYHAQRNIDYGSSNGNQMFLFDFTGSPAPDASAPTVALAAPANGSVVTGTVAVTASASSSAGIAKVEFYLDTQALVGTATSSPYTVNLDTSTLTQGSTHTLTARAFGNDGQVSSSNSVSIVIKDTTAPTVTLTSPASGAKVSSATTLAATASDNIGVVRVDFSVDGKVVASDTSAPFSVSWNPASVALGSHTIGASAVDAAGNTGSSSPVSVVVADTTPPAVTISRPTNGSTVSRSSTVTISATASDNRGVARVEFSVNNVLRCTDTASPYTCAWVVPSTRGATYTIRVRAYDSSGNSTTATVTVTGR